MSLELHWGAVSAVLLVGVGAMAVLVAEVSLAGRQSFLGRPVSRAFLGSLLALISGFFLLLAFGASVQAFSAGGASVFNVAHPMLFVDPLANFSIALLALFAFLSVLLSKGYLEELRINHGEYYALLLLATSGMMLLVSSSDMIMLFLALEIMSIPIYVLAGFDRRRLRSNESALKYFIAGSFASAILLYGMALLFGVTGHTDFAGIRAGLDGSRLSMVGIGLVLIGLTFKISSVPFHQWTPDVYEGAPTSVTAYMSVTVKVAAFVALLRVATSAFAPAAGEIQTVLLVLAAATMVVGNFMAVVQDNVKRLLAYSAIAHAGYVLIGLVTATPDAHGAVLFYLVAYSFTNLGAFGVVVALAHRGQDCDEIDDFAGLAKTRPGMAALMTLFMISLAGIPGTVGFMAKFHLFLEAVKQGYVGLTILAVLASVVSVYYYLRLPVVMYMREPGEETTRGVLGTGEGMVLVVCALMVLLLGLFPNDPPTAVLSWIRALDWTRASVAMLP